LVYFMAKWFIFWLFVIYFPFWYFVARKIWQPCPNICCLTLGIWLLRWTWKLSSQTRLYEGCFQRKSMQRTWVPIPSQTNLAILYLVELCLLITYLVQLICEEMWLRLKMQLFVKTKCSPPDKEQKQSLQNIYSTLYLQTQLHTITCKTCTVFLSTYINMYIWHTGRNSNPHWAVGRRDDHFFKSPEQQHCVN
jgi:hypothetical protein